MADWNFPENRKMKGAIFGSGQVTAYHMRGWKAIPNVEIIAVANRTAEKAVQLADMFGIDRRKVYASHQELLEKEEIDFVDIATAPQAHYAQVMDSIKGKKHVLCQKPFSVNLDLARQMAVEAEKAKILLSINENWRWRSWYRKIKEILDSGLLGKLRYLNISRHENVTLARNNGESPALLTKQPYTRDMEHLLLFEWGIHIVDVTRFLVGDAERVTASMVKTSPYFQGEDRAIVTFQYPEIEAILDLSWATVTENDSSSVLEKVLIEGEEGSLKVLPDERIIQVITRDQKKEMPAFSHAESEEYQSSYTRAQAHFIQCLRHGLYPETWAQDNLKTFAAVFAAYEANTAKRSVDLGNYFQRI